MSLLLTRGNHLWDVVSCSPGLKKKKTKQKVTIDVQMNLKGPLVCNILSIAKSFTLASRDFFLFLFFVFTKAYIWASNTAAPKGFQHTWRSSRYSVSPQGHPFGWWLCLLSGDGILGRTVGITLRVKLVFAKSWSLQRFSGCLHPIVTKRRRENFYAERLFNLGTFSFRWWQFDQIPNSSTRERSSWSIRLECWWNRPSALGLLLSSPSGCLTRW